MLKVILVLILLVVTEVSFPFTPDKKPLTEEQLIEMSNTSLKSYPDEIIKLIKELGVNFFPTKTVLNWLEKEGVDHSVIPVILSKAAEQMRIKVCRFACDDNSISEKFERLMIEYLRDAKRNVEIEPFGRIPLDDKPCTEQGFDDTVKPESNIFYILIEGSIKKTAADYSLKLWVIYRDPSGKPYPLPDAENPPASFTTSTLEQVANEVIQWSIRTAVKYAKT